VLQVITSIQLAHDRHGSRSPAVEVQQGIPPMEGSTGSKDAITLQDRKKLVGALVRLRSCHVAEWPLLRLQMLL